MRILFSLLMVLALSVAISAQADTLRLTESIYFASAEDIPKATELAKLEAFADRLKSYAAHTLRIEAFTDEQGTEAYNEDLAQRRALHCTRVLAKKNVTPTTSSILTHGEQRARQNTSSDAQRKDDRRVDLVAAVVRWADTRTAIAALHADLKEIIPYTDPSSPRIVRGRKNGTFRFPSNSLVREDGSPAIGPVTIELTEAYTLSDMLLAGLSTTSGGQRLETGGMVKLTATDARGQFLRLREGYEVTASIPTDYYNPDMKIFTGANLNEDGAPTDWVLTEGTVTRPQKAETDSLTFTEYLAGMDKNLSLFSDGFIKSPRGNRDLFWNMQNDPCLSFYAWLKENPAPDTPVCVNPATYRVKPKPEPLDTSKIVYQPVGTEKVFMSKKQKNQITTQRRRAALKVYERRLKRHIKSAEYLAQLPEVNARKIATYEADLNAWLVLVEEQKNTTLARLTRYHYLVAEASRLAIAGERQMERVLRERAGKMLEKDLLSADILTGKQKDVDRYVFTMTELGWANCDLFFREGSTVPVLASLNYSSDAATVMLLPTGRRSVIPYERKQNGTWRNRGIPKGLSYHIIAYEVIDGKMVMAHKYIAAADGQIHALDYKPVGITDLKDRIKELVGS